MNTKDKKIVTEKKRRLKDGFSGESFDATREDIRRGYAIGKDGRKQYTYDAGHDVNEPQSVANFDADENHYSRDDSVQYRVEPRIDIQDANQGTAYQRLNNWSRIVKDFDKEADGNYSERGLGKRIREFGDSIIESENFPSDGLYLLDRVCELLKKYSDLYAQYFSYTDSMGKTDYESPFDWKEEIKSRVEKSKEERKNHMKWSGKPSKLPESAEKPFNGMSVANMRFLNEWTEDDEAVDFGPKEEAPNYEVGFWPGGGYHLHTVTVNADSDEQALEKAVVQLEKDNLTGLILDPAEVEAEAEKDGIYNPETGEGTREFYETYMYVDATMEGASQPWYVYAQNLRIREITPEIPEGYDNDGYDSMDDNALPEDF